MKVAAPLCALLLGACTVGPNYRAPEPASLSVPDTYYGRAGAGAPPADLARWWERFDDPLLTRLIDEASAGNLDLAPAAARLVQARESLVQARAGLVPTVGASAGAGRDFGPGNDRSSFSLGADAAWEVDLFGRIRRGIEAAARRRARASITTARRCASRSPPRSRPIISRRGWRRSGSRSPATRSPSPTTISRSPRWRVQAGLVSSLDSEQARAARAQTAAAIPNIENSLRQRDLPARGADRPGAGRADRGARARRSRSPTGRQTSRSASPPTRCASAPTCAPPSATSPPRPRGSASPRRSSIRRCASPGISAPRPSRSAACSTRSPAASSPGSSQTLFDGGRLRSQLRSQQAATEGALAAYRQSVLTSLEDVENALLALRAARERQAQFAIALEAANNTAILARSQYRSGLTDFQQLLEAERSPALRARRPGQQPRRRGARARPALSCPRRRLGPRCRPRDRNQPMNDATRPTVTNQAARPTRRRSRTSSARRRRSPGTSGRSTSSALVVLVVGAAAAVALLRRHRRGRLCDRDGAARQSAPSPSRRPAISSRPTRSRSAPSNRASSPRCSSTITIASPPASRSPGSTRRGCRTRSSRRRPALASAQAQVAHRAGLGRAGARQPRPPGGGLPPLRRHACRRRPSWTPPAPRTGAPSPASAPPQAQVAQARAQLSSAQTNLSKATIYSPVTGVVLSRQIDPGQTVAASFQAPVLFTIAEDLVGDEARGAGRRGRCRPGPARASARPSPSTPIPAAPSRRR